METISYFDRSGGRFELLDLGIYRLDKLVNEDPFGSATVTYDWESNKINIRVMILEWVVKGGRVGNTKNKEEAYDLVSQIVNSIRTKLGVNYRTGKIISGDTALEACFRPVAERNRENEPKNLKEELFKMTEISVNFSGQYIKVDGKAALRGTEIYFDE